ncbi:hypothetical protein EOD41_08660 [Mucilaginibacter limnophilus]|uniref:Uncharacterized protein n=1 Tax=Mucilaginibacter limnophilus TaxID=1932778 RepID=A0A437MWF2_9SPHI|nr:hypothetical protein [Mucilaginibacter limnophilus]RVU02012.1 hypothetical protein EOD41_08660 [Mucilaginibacter limnophilus]
MLKKLFIAGAVVLLFTSCEKNTKCGERICDASFAYVSVQFVNANSEHIAVKNFTSVNKRTGDTLIKGKEKMFTDSIYVVADDSHVRKLSENGDEIKVSATDSATNVTKTAVFKVSGGECECHISKISGPDKITFN